MGEQRRPNLLGGRLALPTFDFALDGIPDEVRPLLPVAQNSVDPGQRPGGESSWRLFFVDAFAAHGWNIDDIT